MNNEQTALLCCSFCGKNQREVRKLIAGPKVFICDECIGLCNQIIAEEYSRQASPPTPESARGLLAGLVERERNFCELLGEVGRHADASLPEPVRKALLDLVAASNVLRAEMQSGASGEARSTATEVSAWLRPCLERLGGTIDSLRALRLALEGLVPGKRLKVVDDAVSQIDGVRGLLVAVAATEVREMPPG